MVGAIACKAKGPEFNSRLFYFSPQEQGRREKGILSIHVDKKMFLASPSSMGVKQCLIACSLTVDCDGGRNSRGV